MLNCIRRFDMVISKVSVVAEYIAIVALFLLMLTGAADVIARYVVHEPIRGIYSIHRMLLLVAVFFGIAMTQRVRVHVTLDIIYSRFSKKSGRILDIIINLVSLAIFALITWQTWVKAILSSRGTEILDVVAWPVWPFQVLVSIGFFMLCMEFISQILHNLLLLAEMEANGERTAVWTPQR